jgi:hypothetical protein
MARLLFCVFVAALVGGCSKPPEDAPAPAKQDDAPADSEPVQLPTATAAAALDKTDKLVFCLDVNQKGRVLLSPADEVGGRDKNTVSAFDNAEQVRIFLKRRALEERQAARPTDRMLLVRNGPSTFIALRVDARIPFKQTAALVRVFQEANFRPQFRATRPDGTEGQFALAKERPFTTLPIDDEEVEWCSVRVAADPAGKIAKLAFLDDRLTNEDPGLDPNIEAVLPELDPVTGKPKPEPKTKPEPKPESKPEPKTAPEIDLGTDITALTKKLKELRVGRPPRTRFGVALEVDEKLLQAEVIRLFDAAAGAGITEFWPTVPEPEKRKKPGPKMP